MKRNMISRSIVAALMLLAAATMSAQPMRTADHEGTLFSLFFNDGNKTQFGLFSGIQFFKEGDRYQWSLIGDEEERRYDIADFVAPIKPLTTPAPELTSQTVIDQTLEITQPTANYSWIAELMSDNVIDVTAPHLPYHPGERQIESSEQAEAWNAMDDYLFRFEKAPQTPYQNDSPAKVWREYYASIAQANRVLQSVAFFEQQADNASIETLKAARAEALLQRAYLHFVLVNLFAQSYQGNEANETNTGIPYMEEVVEEVGQEVPALSVGQVYAKIQRDLEEALGALESLEGVTSKYRFTPQAAHAFAARFYLYTRQWQKVVEHANAVLGTTQEQLRSVMVNFAAFSDLQYASDFTAAWQSEENATNLMLNDTYSSLGRLLMSSRYAFAGLAARKAFMFFNTPLYPRYYVNTMGFLSGKLFGMGNYSRLFPMEIGETFELVDEEVGVGYSHHIMRRFEAQELLLERAEAHLMSGNLQAAKQDLMDWWNLQYDSFTEEDKSNYPMNYMTEDIFDSYFAKDRSDFTPTDWSFTANISPDYVIPTEAWPVMNCLEMFRRYETVGSGLRFFDLKRWGMEYSHFVGPENTEIKLAWNDARRAVQVPWDALYGIPDLQLNTNSLTLEPDEEGVFWVLAGSDDYSFACSNEEVALVDTEYIPFTVKALKPGTATVTVTDNQTGQEQKIDVTVGYHDLVLENVRIQLAQKDTITIVSGSYDYAVESSNEEVVTASVTMTEGNPILHKPTAACNTYQLMLLAQQEGQATVTVKDNKSGQTVEVNVEVSKSEAVTVGDVTFTMMKVDGGNLQCDQNVWMDHDFAIGQTEVTQRLWQTVMGENPSSMVGDWLPVNNVSCDDCQAFIAKLNELTGRTFSLPTKAEWLFAARGGTISEGYNFSGSNRLDNVAWYKGNSGGTVHVVATLAPNELGIYDMQGNVMEFCQDVNANGIYVLIGGAYSVDNSNSRTRYFSWTYSAHTATANANAGFGLRLVLR